MFAPSKRIKGNMTDLQRQYLSMISELDEKRQRVNTQPDSFSFIVRVWKETSDEKEIQESWRGSIERVGLNQRVYVHQLDSILAFIEEQTGMKVKRPHPIKVWWEGLRRWWDSIRNEKK